MYYFASTDSHPPAQDYGKEKEHSILGAGKDHLASAGTERMVYDLKAIRGDTGVLPADTLPPKKSVPQQAKPQTKEEKKQAYIDAKKAYEEAYKNYAKSRAATKDKRRDGFAVAGAVLLTVAFLCINYPAAAVIFGIFGVLLAILGLKSRIWGLSLASLIAAAVILTFYIYFSIVL